MHKKDDIKHIIIIVLLFSAIAIGHTYRSYQKVAEEQYNIALNESKILNDFMFTHRNHYQQLFINKTIQLNEKTIKALPAYSSYEISEKFSDLNDYNIQVRTVSDRARNPLNQADKLETQIINYFTKNPDRKEFFEFVEENKNNQPYYQYGYALRIKDSCLKCHDTPENAPSLIAQRYTQAYGYKLGETRGIISIKIPKKHIHEQVYSRFIDGVLFNFLALSSILAITILMLLKRAKDIERLEIATKKVKSADLAKSEFLANMSHEIRTPLNAILGFVSILQENTENEQNKQYLTTIDRSSKHLLGIINDVLDFSKIESSKLEIENIPFRLKDEVLHLIKLFEPKAKEKKLSLTVNYTEETPEVISSDLLRIKQIISNLLSNAIKFTSENKKIEVHISYKDNTLYVNVKDEGKGIANNKLSHIFESFSQEDSSTTREFGGTGLGLTISHKLVALLGGELKVKSEEGVGSEFYFSIKAKKAELLNAQETNYPHIPLVDKKLLLVEDDTANQMYMKIIIKQLGLQFDIANDGLEAIESFKNNHYDVILMDENMPNMNGIEACKNILIIEKKGKMDHTPIIALTANAMKGDRERFLAAGMDEYLTKPINKKTLKESLCKLLNPSKDGIY